MSLNKLLNYDELESSSSHTDEDKNLVKFVINEAECHEDGRLILPCLWDKKVENLLPNNYKLASNILKSNLKKLGKNFDKLKQYNNVFLEQLESGIIEEVNNNNNNGNISFLGHMGVFRESVETTKCRVVFLSNLCEGAKSGALSHNQISIPGPNLNNKMEIALTLLRFNKFLLIYDVIKAFHMLHLSHLDTLKFHFLWVRDIKSDFSEVIYRMKRVPFGMRFSPCLLMIALYIILILHCYIDDPFEIELRNMLYNLSYMDNIAFSSDSENDIILSYHKSINIFSQYGFNLQQFSTNLGELEAEFEESSPPETKLLGILWKKDKDLLTIKNIKLNAEAKTLRSILASVNSCFDPLSFTLPCRNRAKLFLHDLQRDSSLSWDTSLGVDRIKEWIKICKLYNSGIQPVVPRCIGNYKNNYDLIAFTDSSKDLFGCVIYLKDPNTNFLHFLTAKNKVVSSKGVARTIPVLELFAVAYGVECMMDLYNNLTRAFCPVKINNLHLFTDSTIALSWLAAKTEKTSKIEKKGTVINNKLSNILRLCEAHKVIFHHIAGLKNPADVVTRCVSHRVLNKTNYFTGPNLTDCEESFVFEVPFNVNKFNFQVNVISVDKCEPLIALDRYSSIHKLCRVVHYVRRYIHLLKCRVKSKKPHLFPSIEHECKYQDSCTLVYKTAQQMNFQETYNYLLNPLVLKPTNLANQLNLFLDSKGLIRVKSKFGKLKGDFNEKFPMLLSKFCPLTKNLIFEYHSKMKHAGVYRLLYILKKEFYIPSAYITVKKVIKSCFICKKLYGRTIHINTNDYREFRISPKEIPYREIALDHIGPFYIKVNDSKVKVYILIITCMWSRGVNLLICKNINAESFINAFQIHVYDFGYPEKILSDAGSPIVKSFDLIKSFLNDNEVINFLKENNINALQFSTYPPTSSFLGGIVESLVKQIKNMVYSTISKNVLNDDQFYLLVKEINMLINKRPLAFKPLLNNNDIDPSVPQMLSPELLLKGYDVPCVVVAPHLHISESFDDEDPDWVPHNEKTDEERLFKNFKKFKKVKSKLHSIYHHEFLSNLRDLSTNRQGRYKPKDHVKLQINDIVAIKQKFQKPYFFPVGVITEVRENDLGEVVEVSVKKGNGEIIKRHVNTLILLKSSVDQ